MPKPVSTGAVERRYSLVVLGVSSGGMAALGTLVSALPSSFALPIVAVQHRNKDSDATLVRYLQGRGPLPVSEPADKEIILPGHVYIAPPNYHLLIEGATFALSTDAPVNFARPAIDVLFETAADAYRERLVGVVLTGATADGAKGLARIKARGGLAIVQNPANAESPAMPAAAIAATKVDHILEISELAPLLTHLARDSRGL